MQIGHSLLVNNRTDRLLQTNSPQERRLRHARLHRTLYQFRSLVLGHENLDVFVPGPGAVSRLFLLGHPSLAHA